MNEYFKFVYDRRHIDLDVFKKFQANGEIIKMTVDAGELAGDKTFKKTEEEIHERAQWYINSMKRIKPFDTHKIQPQTYDLKMLGDPGRGGQKKKNQAELDKKKADAAKKQKKKAAAKIGEDNAKFLDDIPEDGKEDGSDEDEESDGVPDDKYDPLSK